jgi:DHA1 family tetracycline resistance protein-like MFS transporter
VKRRFGKRRRKGEIMKTGKSFDERATAARLGAPGPAEGGERKRELGLLFMAVFSALMSQFIFLPVLPPLAREVGLSELQAGLLITVAALMFVVGSPLWGRGSDVWGRKPVLIAGMVGVAVSFYAFNFVAQLGLGRALAGPLLFALMLATRGVLFGIMMPAVLVSSQAYVADTTGQSERTRGIAAIQGANGLGLVVGPALGGLLAGISLLAPLYLAPTLILLVALLIWRLLPEPPKRADLESSPRLSPVDGRVWPFLLVGFTLFLSLGVANMTVGFLFQDRLVLAAQETARAVGLALLATGLAAALAQLVLVPKLDWSPPTLIRVGIPVKALGFSLLVFADGFVPLTLALVLVGLGFGLAVPGYTAAPTLLVGDDEQGGVAGLISATNGLAFVLGPLLGTALYGLRPEYPYVFSVVILAMILVFVLASPRVRSLARKPRVDK